MRASYFPAIAAVLLLASTAGAQGAKPIASCPDDAVLAGTVCVDKYEASVWFVPNGTGKNRGLVKKIQQGKATLADLQRGGATPRGIAGDDYFPFCMDDGAICLTGALYAVSLPGVSPSGSATWFQASALCAASKKRLPTNAEWQVAAFARPNADALCNTASGAKTNTGSLEFCVSDAGAFDMTGNLIEWVADWVPLGSACPGWGQLSNDFMCLAGAHTVVAGPGALQRGGLFISGAGAGPLAIITQVPWSFGADVGFRCAR